MEDKLSDSVEGYRKFRANELPKIKREQVRATLRYELTETLIASVRENPPKVDLSEVEILLNPGESLDEMVQTAWCLTCITCDTCVTS